MKSFLMICFGMIVSCCLGQSTDDSLQNYFVGEASQELFLNQKNDLIIINPSKRIFCDNQTVYVENDFERKYKPYSNKNRIDSDSFLAQTGGFILVKSTMFLFEQGLEALLQPKTHKQRHPRSRESNSASHRRRFKGN